MADRIEVIRDGHRSYYWQLIRNHYPQQPLLRSRTFQTKGTAIWDARRVREVIRRADFIEFAEYGKDGKKYRYSAASRVSL